MHSPAPKRRSRDGLSETTPVKDTFGTPGAKMRYIPGSNMVPHVNGSNIALASPDPISRFHEGPGGMRVLSAKTPQGRIPLIHGSGVTVDSPDVRSKFHDGPGAMQLAYHGPPSSSFGTPGSTREKASVPLIYGSGVTMESPDPMSKFHGGPGGMRLAPSALGTPTSARKPPKAGTAVLRGPSFTMESPDPMSKFHEGPGGLRLAMSSPHKPMLADAASDGAPVPPAVNGLERSLRNSQDRVLKNLLKSRQFDDADDSAGVHSPSMSASPNKLMNQSWTKGLDEATRTADKENIQNHNIMENKTANSEIYEQRGSTDVHFEPRPPPKKPPSKRPSEPFRRSRRGLRNSGQVSPQSESELSPSERHDVIQLPPPEPGASSAEIHPISAAEDTCVPPCSSSSVEPQCPLEVNEDFEKGNKHDKSAAGVSPTSVVDCVVEHYVEEREGGVVSNTDFTKDLTAMADDVEVAVTAPRDRGSAWESKQNNDDETQSDGRPSSDVILLPDGEKCASNVILLPDGEKCASNVILLPNGDVSTKSEGTGDDEDENVAQSLSGTVQSTCPRAQRPQGKKRRGIFKQPTVHSKLDVIYEDHIYTKDVCTEANDDICAWRETCADGIKDTYRIWTENQCRGTGTLEVFSSLYDKDFKRFKSLLSAYEDEGVAYPVDENGNTLLMAAALLGFRKVARYLVRKGVGIDLQNIFGNTSLHFAREMNQFGIVDILLKKGANGLICNKLGNTFSERVMTAF